MATPNLKMVITAKGASDSVVNSGDTTNDGTLTLTFTLDPNDKATTNFASGDIYVNGVSGDGISSFNGSGNLYTAVLTQSGEKLYTINVPADSFTDLSGNNNIVSDDFLWTYDGTSPTVTISSNDISNNKTSNHDPLPIKFTLSEASTDFSGNDITLGNCTISNFAGSGVDYTAELTPTTSGECTVNVDAGKFTDSAGNNNLAASQFTWTYLSAAPKITITAKDPSDNAVITNSTTNDAVLQLTFTSNHETDDFVAEDVTVSNGSITPLTQLSNNVYTATLTPGGEGPVTVDIAGNTFTDIYNNVANDASTQFVWNYDNTGPTMTITAVDSADPPVNIPIAGTTNDTSIALTFTSNEDTTNFAVGDIVIESTNGAEASIDNFTVVSDQVYTADLTLTKHGEITIKVEEGAFTDSAGNDNSEGVLTFNYIDNVAPTMTITSNVVDLSGSVNSDTGFTFTFTSNEDTTDFEEGNITLNNCTISNFFAESDKVYTATITPTAQGHTSVMVAAGAFSDAGSNQNTESNTIAWNHDSIRPTVDISANDHNNENEITSGDTTNDPSLNIIFTITDSNLASSMEGGFKDDDITVTNGSISELTEVAHPDASINKFTATFTPSGDGLCEIKVEAGEFTDMAGNSNTASNTFTWTYDSTRPTMTITSDTVSSGDTTNDTTIVMRFTSNEDMTGFEHGDIDLSNCSLGPLTDVSDKVKTAVLTPTADGECAVSVAENKFQDPVGNDNTASNTFTWTFDSVAPTVTIDVNDANDINTVGGVKHFNNSPITLKITSSENIVGLEVTDFTITGGATFNDLSNLSINNAVATVDFTPPSDGTFSFNIMGGSEDGKFTDPAGNKNATSNTLSLKYDGTKPVITIVSDTTLGTNNRINSQSIDISINLVEGDLSGNFGDLSESDFTFSSDCSLNDTLTVSGTIATAQFVSTHDPATNDGVCTITLPANTFVDKAGNGNDEVSFTWTFDGSLPSATLSSSTVNEVGGNNYFNGPIDLTIVLSEDSADFTVNDLSLNNCSASNFTGSGKNYSVQLGPNGAGTCQAWITVNRFTDFAGNSNSQSNTFEWTHDVTNPTISMVAKAVDSTGSVVSSGATTNDASLHLTFTVSEAVNNFAAGDISVTGGSISNFNGTGTEYTATFTPNANSNGKTECTINVGGVEGETDNHVFTDYAGNKNQPLDEFTWTFDSTSPVVAITSTDVDSGKRSNVNPISLTFTVTETGGLTTTNFIADDITVSDGEISNFTDNGDKTYTADFTAPAAPDGEKAYTINVAAGEFNDDVGNGNAASNDFTWTYDVTSPIPTLSVSGAAAISSGDSTNDDTVLLTINTGEATTNFLKTDITVTNGTLGTLNGSGNSYTIVFTPTDDGPCSFNINAGVYTDEAGNNNSALASVFNWTYDSTHPSMTITSDTVSSGDKTNNDTIVMRFESSEDMTGFELGDISVGNGSLGPLTHVSDKVKTAVLTPAADGECTLSVAADKFTDPVGNLNTASNTFTWTYDSTHPTLTITSATTGLAHGGHYNNDVTLTLTTTEATTDLSNSDVTVVNGTKGELTGSGTVWSITISPEAEGTCSAIVPVGSFSDAAGNLNDASSNTFSWTHDVTRPTPVITAAEVNSGETSNDAEINLTIDTVENTTDFGVNDITATNGSLSDFLQVDAKTYTVTFTPDNSPNEQLIACAIDINQNRYTDPAGNLNNAASQFSWTHDTVKPSITITANVDNNKVTNDETLSLTLTSSKSTTDLSNNDVVLSNCSISSLTPNGDNTVFTATLVPDGEGQCTVDVAAGVFTDAFGNTNTAATQFVWTFDSVHPTPTLTVSGAGAISSGDSTNDATVLLTITTGEGTTNLVNSDISVTNGSLNNTLAGSGDTYTATFTPASDGLCTFNINADVYTDEAGNGNNALGAVFNWTYDSTKPAIAITAKNNSDVVVNSGDKTNDQTLKLTFTVTDAHTVSFEADDVSVTNGSISGFDSTNAPEYTATLTPDANVNGITNCSVVVAKDTFQDATGNLNTASNTFTWDYDGTNPSMTISVADTDGNVVHGGFSRQGFVTATFESSEITSNFELGDIDVTNGVASEFVASTSKIYTAKITPSAEGVCTVNVLAAKFTDGVGNDNTAANGGTPFSFTQDLTVPTIAITSAEVNSGESSNDAEINLTFTVTDANTVTFEKDDITTNGGTISNFDNTNAPAYTAKFSPATGGGSLTSQIFYEDFEDDTANEFIESEISGNILGVQRLLNAGYKGNYGLDVRGDVVAPEKKWDLDPNGNPKNGHTLVPIENHYQIPPSALGGQTVKAVSFWQKPNFPRAEIEAAFNMTMDHYENSIMRSSANGSNFSYPLLGISTRNTQNNSEGKYELRWSTSGPSVSKYYINGTLMSTSGTRIYTYHFPQGEESQWHHHYIEYSGTAVTSIRFLGGQDGNKNTQYTGDGQIDEIRIFDSALTDAQIANLAAGGEGSPGTSENKLFTIDVAQGTFEDAAGNPNDAATQFQWIYDDTKPAISVVGSVNSGDRTNDANITLTFTVTDVHDVTFQESDITHNGSITSFVDNGDKTYTVILEPDSGSEQEYSVNVLADTFQDSVGNNNTALQGGAFTWTYDVTNPTMTITASEVNSGDRTNDATLSLTFTSSESTTNFNSTDITVNHGSISNFNGSGTVYTATYTPANTDNDLCTINVNAASYTDVAGNSNNAAVQFEWTCDRTKPQMTVSSSTINTGDRTNDPTIALTFTSTKGTANFVASDVSVSNGSIGALTEVSSTEYTATFTPSGDGLCEINVLADRYTDDVTNLNEASNTIQWTFDSLKPSLTIDAYDDSAHNNTVAHGTRNNATKLYLKLTSSEDTTELALNDLYVSDGKLSNFSQPDVNNKKVYTVEFEPVDASDNLVEKTYTIDLAADKFRDVAGNFNTAANSGTPYSWTYDSTRPTVTISAQGAANVLTGGATQDATLALTFTTSEPTTNFVFTDITVSGCSVGVLTPNGDKTVHTCTLTPSGQGLCTVNVSENVFTDEAGNGNTAMNNGFGTGAFEWIFDTVSPTMTITAQGANAIPSGRTTNDSSITVTFTSSENTSSFQAEDIVVTNGTISNFQAVGGIKVYTATFTPSNDGLCTIKVNADSYIDSAANKNLASNVFNWTFDGTKPSINITAAEVNSGDRTNDDSLSLTFTATEDILDGTFTSGDITANNGLISDFQKVNENVYTAVFTPDDDGLCTISVVANKFTDLYGNNNTASNTFTWVYDTTGPVITISATKANNNGFEVTSGGKSHLTTIKFSFTADENMVGFDVNDITVGSGSVANFTKVSDTEYTAEYSPDNGFGNYSINVLQNTFQDALGHDNSAANDGTAFTWVYKLREEIEAEDSNIDSDKISKLKNVSFGQITNGKAAMDATSKSALVASISGTAAEKRSKRKSAIRLAFSNDANVKKMSFTKAELGIPDTTPKSSILAVKAGETLTIADLGRDEGFYAALVDGETFSAITENRTVTFTRADSGNEERYTVALAGNNWNGIEVRKHNACNNFNLANPSGVGSYLVPDDIIGIDDRKFVIGSIADGGAQGALGTNADPYVFPINGNPYKLPDEKANYCLYSSKSVFISAGVDKLTEKEQNNLRKWTVNKTGSDKYENADIITDGYFYDRVFINTMEGVMEVDLINKTATCSNNKAFNVTYENKKDISELYRGEQKVVMNITWQGMSINIDFFKNPQVRTGVSICYASEEKAYGLLCNSYKPAIFKLNSLKNKKDIFNMFDKFINTHNPKLNEPTSLKLSNEKWSKH